VVIGTTNQIHMIDPALRRPGRFEHEICFGIPNPQGRRQIFQIHTQRMPLAEQVDLDRLAEKTHGFSGADIAALCREAGYQALRRSMGAEKWNERILEAAPTLKVTPEDFQKALQVIKPSAMREVMIECPKLRWEDVGGLEEEKRIIIESVIYGMQRAEAYQRMGIRPTRGLLLYGPPGTGKTLLAKAAASECGANFIAIRGPEVYSKWFGESEERIRFIFAKAREVAPAILFFDELDAIGSRRGHPGAASADAVVNQLLAELDGIEALENVFVLGATNAIDLIDPALLRPGRFDVQIYIPLPDPPTRKKILHVHTAHMPLDQDVRLEEWAEQTEGFSGADLAELCRLAGLNALRDYQFRPEGQVGQRHFQAAFQMLCRRREEQKPKRVGFTP